MKNVNDLVKSILSVKYGHSNNELKHVSVNDGKIFVERKSHFGITKLADVKDIYSASMLLKSMKIF